MIICLEMCLQNGSVHCTCNKVSLQSPVKGGGTFTLLVSAGGTSTETLVLLQVQVAGPSVGDAATALMRMMVVAALFLGTSSLDRQSAALL